MRLVQTSIEDMVDTVGSFRIRQSSWTSTRGRRRFPPTGPEDVKKLERIGVLTSSPLQLLLTAASTVACSNAIVGGVAVALAVGSLLEASVPVAAVTGAVVAATFATLFLAYQVRRFRRAGAVVPELYEGQSPDMPGSAEHATTKQGWLVVTLLTPANLLAPVLEAAMPGGPVGGTVPDRCSPG